VTFAAAFAALALAVPGSTEPVRSYVRNVSVQGREIPAKVVEAQLSAVRVRVGFGQGRMSRTESLAGIASRYGAVAAINGSFFESYTSNPIKNPHHTLISGGKLLHLGTVGTMIGFGPDGQARIGRATWKIKGTVYSMAGKPNSWYAYWINRYPTGGPAVTIFTPEWGPETGLDGLQAVVRGERIAWLARYSVAIPSDGYVVYFAGAEERLGEHFKIERPLSYTIARDGPPDAFWDNVQEALGAGPLLLRDGAIALDPQSEGFKSDKILWQEAARSAVGLTADGRILFVAAKGTIRQLAALMKALGCQHAMNLDGGASSCLWAGGRYLREPGRAVANALLIVKKG
jgi:exopolysaccharide biosynthesis protein